MYAPVPGEAPRGVSTAVAQSPAPQAGSPCAVWPRLASKQREAQVGSAGADPF